MTEEEKLRAEAARRMERRRRKLENAEERLAKITGQPIHSIDTDPSDVAAGFPDLAAALPNSGLVSPFSDLSELIGGGEPVTRFRGSSSRPPPRGTISSIQDAAPDPPLDNLVRDPLRSGVAKSAPLPEVSSLIWVLQALLTFTLLQSGFGGYILNSVLLPFLLLLVSLYTLGRIHLASSVGSIVSAVLVLCGLRPTLAHFLIRSIEIGISVSRLFCLYLTTIIILQQLHTTILGFSN
ncbi:uncharacterized protein LOC111701672 [Eurytemora carolleeae]|uniref:uncharacterized protein LOC111701672 n=1 Tax=Eurytemora carolleeae TaxID=1294199 RepID=UPI000C76BE7F|nr:uncharacterized protein LOC111701672 [Eurytemora carolleeae]|eukprot:XP_023328833.1 uncharacterized protein LOC111701672 [Eurytemora affinis]